MARIKPTEIRLVAELLMQPADSAEEKAKEIITALDQKREGDEQFALLFQWQASEDGRPVVIGYGPYPTRNQALKDSEYLISPGPSVARAMTLPLSRRVERE